MYRRTLNGVWIALFVSYGVAEAQPRLPKRLSELLERAGIETQSGEGLLGGVHPGLGVPAAPDAKLAEAMAKARREDVVRSADDTFFGQANIDLGQWQSVYFLDHYGTALFLAEKYDDERIPVFLVHGINGSPRDFAPLAKHFEGTRFQPVFFFYPTGMPLTDAARQLGIRLQEFAARHEVERYAIVAHSMGGLVAKGMLHEFDAESDLPGWRTFVSISSPWGGVDAASGSNRLPHHPPVWDDMPPTSTFLRKINATPFPQEMPFYLFFGARSSRSLLSALGNNDGVLTLDSVVGAPVTRWARDVDGFYEDHTSILAAPLVYRRLDAILDAELPADEEEEE